MKNRQTDTINEELLIRLQKGDEKAFELIFLQYSPWVYNFVHSLLHDKTLAEDLTQNVFLKIWEKRSLIDPKQKFESYIFTIARHLVYKETESRLQAEGIINKLEKQLTATTDLDTEEEIVTGFLKEYIDQLIEELPPARKMIYKLSRQEHLSNKEIAAQLAISEKTVETQIYRSLLFIKKKLSSDTGISLLLLLLIC
ncbi:RNA polymerase sigma-70 factor [Parabacteroides sp. PF5-9]|uniref:RNA polymerase sigma factor n=1 Tax=Parabacteroides sp. PF5-9 TaxID=1742404 RepID=UPI002473E5A5|nr:RNA polymerase sigma-70 factor [Parabacteroides sp. PF5-9]MDH6358726.1 RNA polymerase sigma-70 factor (family 1) [Parabacteroides sp. PF5-9]